MSWPFCLWFLLTYNYSQNLSQFFPWVLIFLGFGTIIPGFYVLWLMETGKVRDIHISDPKERRVPFMIAGISSVIGALLLMFLGAARPVIVMAVTYAANALAVALDYFVLENQYPYGSTYFNYYGGNYYFWPDLQYLLFTFNSVGLVAGAQKETHYFASDRRCFISICSHFCCLLGFWLFLNNTGEY